jgi:hypothetical protein
MSTHTHGLSGAKRSVAELEEEYPRIDEQEAGGRGGPWTTSSGVNIRSYHLEDFFTSWCTDRCRNLSSMRAEDTGGTILFLQEYNQINKIIHFNNHS